MRTYTGKRAPDGRAVVMVSDGGRFRPLPVRLRLFRHSPDGFEWGYSGSGPAQLALAILADHFDHAPGDALRVHDLLGEGGEVEPGKLAVHLHQRFKARAIAGLDKGVPWTMTSRDVSDHVRVIEGEMAQKRASNG